MIGPRYVARGVEWLATETPTLPPATHTNSYLLGEEELVLVEPAPESERERHELRDHIRARLDAGAKRLAAIVLTHHHADHVGAAAWLHSELGAPLWAHPKTVALLPKLAFARTLSEGDVVTLDDDGDQAWHVRYTPGHAPGHICLWQPSRRLAIVGDMVASHGTILIAPGDGDMKRYIEELERLANLDAQLAMPAHGDPIENPTATFRHYIEHRLAREAKIALALDGLGSSGATPADLVPIVYDDAPKSAWPYAALSVHAHLIKLVDEGRASSAGGRFMGTTRER